MTMASDGIAARRRVEAQGLVLAAALALQLGLALRLATESGRLAALFLLGALLGITLLHASFGFAAAYRNAIVRRDVTGLRAQLVMVGLATLLFAPVLAQGSAFGQPVVGAVAPVGASVALGSFLFGLGMQLGGGCGSGTLYALGGGSLRLGVTLVAFCAGGFLASLQMGWWAAVLPGWEPLSLAGRLGWGAALAAQTALLLLLWAGLGRWGRGAPQSPLWRRELSGRMMLAGPWPPLLGAALLAVLNGATLVVAGHPWSITWGFTLWGASVAAALGWEPATSPFWATGFPAAALAKGVLADVTSVMDLGLLAGALLAAGAAGRFAPRLDRRPRALLAAVLGGLLMGYGARLSFGCNVGAFFSGAASTSLHGWLWLACALPGAWLGVRLRPLFGFGR